jgi:hypothetical protein
VFSNCGAWVNAVAFGNQQVGVYPAAVPGGYPSPDPDKDYAIWSGTSFAAANFTAALVAGLFDADPTAIHDGTGARQKPNGLDCP